VLIFASGGGGKTRGVDVHQYSGGGAKPKGGVKRRHLLVTVVQQAVPLLPFIVILNSCWYTTSSSFRLGTHSPFSDLFPFSFLILLLQTTLSCWFYLWTWTSRFKWLVIRSLRHINTHLSGYQCHIVIDNSTSGDDKRTERQCRYSGGRW
jgi:hypothetical protein